MHHQALAEVTCGHDQLSDKGNMVVLLLSITDMNSWTKCWCYYPVYQTFQIQSRLVLPHWEIDLKTCQCFHHWCLCYSWSPLLLNKCHWWQSADGWSDISSSVFHYKAFCPLKKTTQQLLRIMAELSWAELSWLWKSHQCFICVFVFKSFVTRINCAGQ